MSITENCALNGFQILKVVSCVVYFQQLLGAARTQILVDTLFLPFSTFLVHFKCFSRTFCLNLKKSVFSNVIPPAFGCAQNTKAGGNTQH